MKGGDDLGPLTNHFYLQMDGTFMQKMVFVTGVNHQNEIILKKLKDIIGIDGERIPKKFAEYLEGSVSENLEIEGPSGNIWHVKLIKSRDTFLLQSGWKNFLTDNKIDKNDTLVFTYNGNSSFEVLIFDSSGCEKSFPFFARNMKTEIEESNDSSVRVVSEPHHTVKTEAITVSSGSDSESVCDVRSRSARGRTRERVRSKRKRRDTVEHSSESDEGNIRVRKTAEQKFPKKRLCSYIVPQKIYLTRVQEEIADKMARQTQKGSELFVKILTSRNCGQQRDCVLNFPRGFASKVLRSKKQVITLLPANLDKSKGCNVKYSKRTDMRCISWLKFVLKNRLKEGDLCLFELRKQEIRGESVLTMLVHFETKSEEARDNLVAVGSASHGEVKRETLSLSSGSNTESYSDISSRSARPLKRKRRDKSTTRKRNANHAKETSRPYLVPCQTYLTKAQEEIANRMTQRAEKDSELFVKS